MQVLANTQIALTFLGQHTSILWLQGGFRVRSVKKGGDAVSSLFHHTAGPRGEVAAESYGEYQQQRCADLQSRRTHV